MNYRMAQDIELVERDGATYLMSAAPLALLRLNAPLIELARRAMAGQVAAAGAGEAKVLEQLALKGFMVRLQDEALPQSALPSISIVIPVLDRAEELARCLDSIAQVDYPAEKLQVIVVDDGSRDDSPQVARSRGALLVSSGGTRRGPAAARNVGAAHATGELLAFIDSDCSASPAWLSQLTPLFAQPRTAAVGGMVEGMCSESAVDRYEAVMSSLTLGSRERFGSSGDDTFYLPSCNLLVRRSLFLSVKGFEESMHVGEDVDLTWRLRDAGWTIAYLPAGSIQHEHRSSLRSFMSRRFDYGTSEGMLQKLHPQRRKRFVLPPLLAMVLALCALAPFFSLWLFPVAAALLAVDSGVYRLRLARRGVALGYPAIFAGRLRAAGGLAYYLSYHLLRYYALALGALALALPALWALPAVVLLISAGVDHHIKKPNLTFLGFTGIYLLEQVAYGAGVFWGCLRGRGFASYRVTILSSAEAAA
jgi:mycofactocin system glycosyltransferase